MTQPIPQLRNIYIDKITPRRYAEEWELFQIDVNQTDPDLNVYHLRNLAATNDIKFVSLQTLNAFYQLRVNYIGHTPN